MVSVTMEFPDEMITFVTKKIKKNNLQEML